MQVGVAAGNQAAIAVLYRAGRGDQQLVTGANGAVVAVIQAASQQGQQTLAGELTALVIDLGGTLDQQRTDRGELAVGVGQCAEQVEGDAGTATQGAVAVVEISTGEGQRLLRVDRTAAGQRHGVQRQGRAAVDQAALGVVQQTADRQRLPRATGKNALVAVVDTDSVDRQGLLAGQCPGIAVEQRTTEGHSNVAAATGDRSVVAVVERASVDRHALPTGQQTSVLVDEVVGAQTQQIVADQLASVAVVQGPRCQIQVLRTAEHTALVIQVTQVVDRQVAGGGDLAGSVVQIARCRAEIEGDGAAQQAAALVVESGAVDGQVVGGVDQAQVLVGQLTINGQPQVGATGQGAAAVVEAAGMRIHRSRRDHALDIAQGLVDTQGQGLVTQQLAVVVAQAFSRQGEGLGAGDLAALVVDALEVVQHQQRRVDQAALVVQLTMVEVQGQRRIALQRTALLVQAGDAGSQVLGADTAAILVGQLGGGQIQVVAAAEETAVTVIEIAGGDQHRTQAADRALLAVVEAGAVQVETAVGDQTTALVIKQAKTTQAQLTGTRQATQAVGQAGRADGQQPFAADRAGAVVQVGTERQ